MEIILNWVKKKKNFYRMKFKLNERMEKVLDKLYLSLRLVTIASATFPFIEIHFFSSIIALHKIHRKKCFVKILKTSQMLIVKKLYGFMRENSTNRFRRERKETFVTLESQTEEKALYNVVKISKMKFFLFCSWDDI